MSDKTSGGLGSPVLGPGARRLLVIGLPVAWLGLGAALGYGAGQIDASAPSSDGIAGAPVAAVWDLPDMVVTLDGPADRPTYLRLAVSLEMTGAADRARDAARESRLLDSFQTALRAMRPADVMGARGTQTVREELARRASRVLGRDRVRDVLIREFVLQ